MESKKRVCCLYRVSKPDQVDNDDIPMQKQACREFSERQGWEIVREYYEKGVSGYKVSSQNRDAILEIQREAAMGSFDILLVFMFDRLGRRDDETPFVVEWFIRNNVAVWSVNEGEQRLDSHVDKLLNYIRYWQASGESVKMSIRVKAGIAQIVGEGHFAGGKAPFGYRLERCGRFNPKKGMNMLGYVVDDEEKVSLVKSIFNKYVNEGYGAQRLVRYLYDQGVVKPNGQPFSICNIQHMLRNELYNGYVKRGETRAFVPALKLIDDDTFNRVTELRKARGRTIQDRKRAPMTTKSAGLLSGNIFCGHCGRKMAFSGASVHHRNQYGEVVKYNTAGYCCRYGQNLGGSKCQQRYMSAKIDDVVRSVLREIFECIRATPPTDCWERQYDRVISEIKRRIETVSREITFLGNELTAYKNEILKVIQGESGFTSEVLNQLIHDRNDKLSERVAELDKLKSELAESDILLEKTKDEQTRIRTWSEIFDESNLETQKMITASLINAVRVSRGYRIEISFSLSVKEFVDGISLNREMLSVSVEK